MTKKYYEEHKEEIAAKNKIKRSQNRLVDKERKKKYYIENRQRILEKQKEYQQLHKAERSEYVKSYNAKNAEKMTASKKKHYAENRDSYIEKSKEYYQDNKDTILRKNKEYSQTSKGRYTSIKSSAGRREIVFNISFDEFNLIYFKAECFYCGGQSTGVDRVDNNIGYVSTNCVACCQLCNTMKLDRGFNEFIEHIARVNDRIRNYRIDK